MRLRTFIPALLLLATAACGSADPTPQVEEAASARDINASVAQAQNSAVNAQMVATGTPDTDEARSETAKNVLGDANALGTAGNVSN